MKALGVVALGAAFALFAACGGGGSETVTGQFVLPDYDGWDLTGNVCHGKGGYSDISGGTQVRLLSGEGDVLDVGRLGDGESTYPRCVFRFTLDVPDGHDFYVVEVGRRGELTYTWEEITTDGALVLTLDN